jgi:hypothetical protein
LRKIAVKGKEWKFKVQSNKTRIDGPKGTFVVPNEMIASGPITPGKMINYITKEYH